MRCLLVDDEPGIREGLATLLRRKGHDVRTAGDCAAATLALAHEFDVVVTDWCLPDGTADAFWPAARCPVVAVSGHPEEVRRDGRVCAVLTKPVAPARLLELLATLTAVDAAPEAAAGPRPAADVVAAIDRFVAQFPAGTPVAQHDDGTFVTVVVRPVAVPVPRPGSRDGDLGWVTRDGQLEARLRLRRDGRTGTPMPVVAPEAAWPDGDLAVDCAGAALDTAAFLRCLDRVAAARRQGAVVQLWNVPEALRSAAASHGRAHDMPMRDPVGPSLQAESADLWREP